ncbi:hypothetical protein PGT21_028347 [Puccinia graminis f. sp. tritici]|uniref:Uncharacterized protein n=1 Tax=Puccinia graminis f. sp. tritici TaxID=56615 RepID=A0A5B0NEZ7_PUCGR|nr:hypothetical protein PGT21_028347 [Puccinia graminis f. sp. tritici]
MRIPNAESHLSFSNPKNLKHPLDPGGAEYHAAKAPSGPLDVSIVVGSADYSPIVACNGRECLGPLMMNSSSVACVGKAALGLWVKSIEAPLAGITQPNSPQNREAFNSFPYLKLTLSSVLRLILCGRARTQYKKWQCARGTLLNPPRLYRYSFLEKCCYLASLDQAAFRSSASEIIGSTDGVKEIASGSSSIRSSKKWKLPKSLVDIRTKSLPKIQWKSTLRGLQGRLKKDSPPPVAPPATASPIGLGSPLGDTAEADSHAEDASDTEELSHVGTTEEANLIPEHSHHSNQPDDSDSDHGNPLSHVGTSEEAGLIPEESQHNAPQPTSHHSNQPDDGGSDHRNDHAHQSPHQSEGLSDESLALILQAEEYEALDHSVAQNGIDATHNEVWGNSLSHGDTSEDGHFIPEEPQHNAPQPASHHSNQLEDGLSDHRNSHWSDHAPHSPHQSERLNDESLALKLQLEEYGNSDHSAAQHGVGATHNEDYPHDLVAAMSGENHIHADQPGSGLVDTRSDAEIARQLHEFLLAQPHDHVEPTRISSPLGENHDHPYQFGSSFPDTTGDADFAKALQASLSAEPQSHGHIEPDMIGSTFGGNHDHFPQFESGFSDNSRDGRITRQPETSLSREPHYQAVPSRSRDQNTNRAPSTPTPFTAPQNGAWSSSRQDVSRVQRGSLVDQAKDSICTLAKCLLVGYLLFRYFQTYLFPAS